MGGEQMRKNEVTLLQEEVFKQFNEVHQNKYDYSEFKYVSENFYSKIIRNMILLNRNRHLELLIDLIKKD